MKYKNRKSRPKAKSRGSDPGGRRPRASDTHPLGWLLVGALALLIVGGGAAQTVRSGSPVAGVGFTALTVLAGYLGYVRLTAG